MSDHNIMSRSSGSNMHFGEGPQRQGSTELEIRLESQKGSSQILMLNLLENSKGRVGRTSLVLLNNSEEAGHICEIGIFTSDEINKAVGPWDREVPKNLKTIVGRNPKDVAKAWDWDNNTVVDTQEAATDTGDLQKLATAPPFFLNFSHYDKEEFCVHVGLRNAKASDGHIFPNIPCPNADRVDAESLYYNNNAFIPPTTDDYNKEFFRHLQTKGELESLKLILEVKPDDESLIYKVFNEDPEDNNDKQNGGDDEESRATDGTSNVASQCDFLSPFKSFWASDSIPTELSFVQIELPGLSSCYLDDWKRFLQLQSKLSTLICNFGPILWNFYAKTVRRNEDSLNKIVLRRVMSFDVKKKKQVPFDFGLFEDCSKLEYLKITTGGYKEICNGESTSEEVFVHVNFDSVPKDNLEEFHFCRFKIAKKTLREFENLCEGKKLRLICSNCPDREYYDGDYPSPIPFCTCSCYYVGMRFWTWRQQLKKVKAMEGKFITFGSRPATS